MFPFKPVGLKMLLLTPCPDQLPLKPPCVVGRLMAGAVSQIEAGTPVIAGVVGVETLMVVVAGLAHCPAFGVKVSAMFPLKPIGLKRLLLTPGPDQLPLNPPCVVGRLMAGEFSQIEAGTPVIAGVVGVVTLMVVVAGLAHCPAFGVKVRVMFPLKPVGLKLLPATPWPDQLPLTPLCEVGSAIGGSF